MTDGNKNPDEIEREVEQARARVSQTVDAIGDKLSPGELLDQVLGMAKDHGGEFARNLGQQVKNNPVALLLTGVGVTWMAIGNSASNNQYESSNEPSIQQSNSAYGSSDRNATDTLKTTAASVSSGFKEAKNTSQNAATSARDKVAGAQEKVASAANSAQQKTVANVHAIQNRLDRALQEQPLIVGGLGVALGAALGALVPASEMEDRLLGSTSDRLKEDAVDEMSKRYDDVRETVKEKAANIEQAATK